MLDTPGNFDFAGEVLSGIRAAECAVLVCGAKDGLSVGAERAWKMLGNKPRMIFINRTDEENSDYNACFDALKGKFGTAVAPIVAPIIDGSKKVIKRELKALNKDSRIYLSAVLIYFIRKC